MEYCCTKFQVGLNFRLCDVFIPQFLWLRGRWPPGCRQTAVCALCAGLEAGFSCSKVLLGPIRQKGRTEAGQGTTPPRMVSHQTRSLSEQDKLLPNARVSGLHGEVAVLACPSPGGRSQPCPGPRGWERSRAGYRPHRAGQCGVLGRGGHAAPQQAVAPPDGALGQPSARTALTLLCCA